MTDGTDIEALCQQIADLRGQADALYEQSQNDTTRGYWLGKWAAFDMVLELLDD